MGTILGPWIPLLERVFNKTRCCTQSLYARARIGIVYSGVKYSQIQHISPLRIPYATLWMTRSDVPFGPHRHRHTTLCGMMDAVIHPGCGIWCVI